MKRILLHIGGGKCGSSSLQKTLTFNPNFGYTGGGPGPINYWLLVDGKAQKSTQVSVPQVGLDYLASGLFSWSEDTEPCIHTFLKPLIDQLSNDEVAIVSCEGLSFQFARFFSKFESQCTCSVKNEVDVVILLITRDIFDWVESSFYQWGLWESLPFEKWLENPDTHTIFQLGLCAKTAMQMGCDKIVVHHLKQSSLLDPIYAILRDWGYRRELFSPIDTLTTNIRASLDEIRLEKRNPGLREIHDSRIEFLLAQLRIEHKLPADSPPHFLTPEIVQYIIKTFSDDRELLKDFCTQETQGFLNSEFNSERIDMIKYRDPKRDPDDLLVEQPSGDYLEKLAAVLLKIVRDQEDFRDVIVERDLAIFERDAVLNSHIWTITRFLRILRSKLPI